ncbi:helix-turn-helix domain-containing protein [Streptomyces sp. NBC_01537]|uniref:IclR family transcriptional regulator n=1 Tax=Streptomyces sp. NBC_01537 TaxID=2903896 RepID=UPI00386D4543
MRSDPGSPSGRQPHAMRNALSVLEEVVAAGPGVTAKEISAALGLPPATTYRLLNLLVAEEYLVRLPDLRGFALGRRAGRLSVPQVPQPCTAARAVVAELRHQVRWGVHLATFTTGRLAITDPDPDHPPTEEALLARYPHVSSLGKLLLAEQAPTYRADARELRRFTPRTITDHASLDRELSAVSDTAIARQHGELRPDRGCLAVPVRSPTTGVLVAGLALCGPPDRIDEPNSGLIALLHDHAARLAPLLS